MNKFQIPRRTILAAAPMLVAAPYVVRAQGSGFSEVRSSEQLVLAALALILYGAPLLAWIQRSGARAKALAW